MFSYPKGIQHNLGWNVYVGTVNVEMSREGIITEKHD